MTTSEFAQALGKVTPEFLARLRDMTPAEKWRAWANVWTEKRWPDYQSYLKSDVWLDLRQRTIARTEGHCEVCSWPFEMGGHVEVHHITYPDRWGHEEICDLAALCSGCHAAVHKLQDKEGLSRRESFLRLIEEQGHSETPMRWSRVGPTWLRRHLATTFLGALMAEEECPFSQEVIRHAKGRWISMTDLKFAKRRLGVTSVRIEGKWHLVRA